MELKQIKEKMSLFVREVIAEGKKVSWSNRREFMGSTVVIIFSILVFSLFIGAVDFILSRLFSLIM